MQPAYISKFISKSKVSTTGNDLVNNIEKKPSEPRWMHRAYPQSVGWKKLIRDMKESQETSQQPKGSPNQQIPLQKLFPKAGENQNQNLPLDIDAVKITTIIETIRRRVQRDVRATEAANDVRGTIAKIRSRRSLHESGNDDAKVTESARHDQERRERFFSKTKRVADTHDLKTASSASIPSTVFYKRIWEYINGTRPHSDIISGYSALENNSNKADNSTCIDKDPITVSQSRKGELRAVNSTVKPERELYKRIWDIINATSGNQVKHKNARARSKRDVNIPTDNTFAAALGRSCVQDEETDREEDEQAPTTDEEARFSRADTTQPGKVSASDPYISGFWAVANKVQWQPEIEIPAVNAAESSNPILPLPANEAIEIADLNRPEPRPAQTDTDDSSRNNTTTGYVDEETRGSKPQDLIEPGPPYSSARENSNTSFSSSADTIDKASRKDDRAEYVEHDETNTSLYDPSNIPYVEVPDYSDRQKDTLDMSNRSANAVQYKEYDDGDYVEPESSYHADDSSSKSPSAKIQLLPGTPAENDEQGGSLDASASRSRCAENQNSAECTDKRGNSEDDTNSDAQRPPEASAERKDAATDFAPIPFDINEYRKPFDLDAFLKEDPAYEYVHSAASKTETKHEDDEKNADRVDDDDVDDDTKESKKSDRDDESEESAKSDRNDESREYESTYPKGKWYDYFARNADFHDGSGAASQSDEDEAEEEDDKPHAEEEAKNSEMISRDYNPHDDDGDFLRHIFKKDDDEEPQSDVPDAEGEFLSRYFTEDVLRQLRDNSTAEEEDRKREESRNREDVHNTLSKILDKKDRFSRLDENLDKMIEEGEAVPIRYNNFWSLEYESPHRKDNEEEEEKKEEEEKEEEEEEV